MAVHVVVLVGPDLGRAAGLVETLAPRPMVDEDVDGGGGHVAYGVLGGSGPPLRPPGDVWASGQLHAVRGHAWQKRRIAKQVS